MVVEARSVTTKTLVLWFFVDMVWVCGSSFLFFVWNVDDTHVKTLSTAQK